MQKKQILNVNFICINKKSTHTPRETHLRRVVFSSGRSQTISTCSDFITGADGNRLSHVLSSLLSLIGQKLYVNPDLLKQLGLPAAGGDACDHTGVEWMMEGLL